MALDIVMAILLELKIDCKEKSKRKIGIITRFVADWDIFEIMNHL